MADPRTPKGKRVLLHTRVPEDHASAVEEAADQLGMGISDFLSLCVADQLKLERPPYLGGPRSKYQRTGKYRGQAARRRARTQTGSEDMPRAG